MINVDEVAVGVLVDAIAATGRRVAVTARTLRDRRQSRDLALARWFETYRLTDRRLELPGLPAGLTQRLTDVLRGDDVQAELQELLAVRLTDAPEADASRVRAAFALTLTLAATGPGRPAELTGPGQTAGMADLAGPLFDFYDDQVCDLVARLEAGEPALLNQIRTEALHARMIAILGAIERHTAALASRPDRRDDAGFLARYRRHVTGQHGRIEPPDFQRRRRVPIGDIYVPTAIFQLVGADYNPELDLDRLAAEIDRTVLLGDPGGGKTTAASVLMHDFAADGSRPVPFLVTVREYGAKDPPELSVVGHIERTLETFYQCPAPPGLVDRLLLTGRALVIFDGLDELLDTSRRADVSTRVERFCAEYPLARVLVTSRVVGYDQARLDPGQFARYRLGGFSDVQVADYARKWFALEADVGPDEAPGWAAAFLSESASVADLRSNPLLLSLMCILYRGEGSLPRDRAEVYQQCASLLFRRWDAHRRIRRDLRAGHLLEPALRHLAWWLFSRDEAQPAVTERDLIAKTTEFLHRRGFESLDAAREASAEFVEFSRGRMWVFTDAGTTAAGERLYGFTHRTFLEYFAAAHVAFDSDTPEDLARTLRPRVARGEWEVVAELAVQIKDRTSNDGAQRAYAWLLGERRHWPGRGRGGVLQFLARCLRSVDPPPQTIRDVTREVLTYLLEGDLDDEDRFLPLCWLLASCTGAPEIVSDEIGNRVASLAASDSDAARVNGLRLAAWLHYGITVLEMRASGGAAEHRMEDFWTEWCAGAVQRHRDVFATEAAAHADIRRAALAERVITLDEALAMPGGLSATFYPQQTGIFAIAFPGYVSDFLSEFFNAVAYAEVVPDGLATATVNLATVGRHLAALGDPPWLTRVRSHTPEDMPLFLMNEQTWSRLPDPVAYLGAAAIAFMIAELTPSASWPYSAEDNLPLGAPHSYVLSRWGRRPPAELPDLPVPDGFGDLFRDWAAGRIDLVAPEAVHPEPRIAHGDRAHGDILIHAHARLQLIAERLREDHRPGRPDLPARRDQHRDAPSP